MAGSRRSALRSTPAAFQPDRMRRGLHGRQRTGPATRDSFRRNTHHLFVTLAKHRAASPETALRQSHGAQAVSGHDPPDTP
ncbi:protein of unknown function [Streptomyces sp. KY75]|nr:protein of unknown function [Streptomyces sp. KY70]CAD5987305.1 protein of unknown function [Streptomyces sp. KY75]